MFEIFIYLIVLVPCLGLFWSDLLYYP